MSTKPVLAVPAESADITFASCIKTNSEFGTQVVTNVCTGEVTRIPWGSADWFWTILSMVGACVIVLAFACAVFGFARWIWNGCDY